MNERCKKLKNEWWRCNGKKNLICENHQIQPPKKFCYFLCFGSLKKIAIGTHPNFDARALNLSRNRFSIIKKRNKSKMGKNSVRFPFFDSWEWENFFTTFFIDSCFDVSLCLYDSHGSPCLLACLLACWFFLNLVGFLPSLVGFFFYLRHEAS